MSALIRRETLAPDARIREYGAREAAPIRKDREVEPVAPSVSKPPELVALEREVESLRRQLDDGETRHREALETAVREAVAEVRRSFIRDENAALELLEASVKEATTQVRERISKLDSLALVMCETVLQKLLGDGVRSPDFLVRAIAAQMAGLRRQTVLAVNVNTTDFPNEAALHKLRGALSDAHIVADPSLQRGECRIDLRLGHIELSLPRHWQAISDELRRMAVSGGPP